MMQHLVEVLLLAVTSLVASQISEIPILMYRIKLISGPGGIRENTIFPQLAGLCGIQIQPHPGRGYVKAREGQVKEMHSAYTRPTPIPVLTTGPDSSKSAQEWSPARVVTQDQDTCGHHDVGVITAFEKMQESQAGPAPGSMSTNGTVSPSFSGRTTWSVQRSRSKDGCLTCKYASRKPGGRSCILLKDFTFLGAGKSSVMSRGRDVLTASV